MTRAFAILAGLAGLSLTGGCADIMQQSAISQIAPEWFEAKAIEVKGEGYPELKDIPTATAVTGTQAEWEAKAAVLKADAAKIEVAAAAGGVLTTDAQSRAMAAQWRAVVEEGAAKALAEAEAAAARASKKPS